MASSIEWVMRTMVVLVSSQISSTSRFISSRVKASSAPNGSSISSTRGLVAQRAHQCARAAACRPTARAEAPARNLRGRRAFNSSSIQTRSGLVPLISKGKLMLASRLRQGSEVGLLEHHADLGVGAGDRLAVEQHFAGGEAVQPRHRPQQRGLAATGRADDRNDLAVHHVERAAIDRQQVARAGVVDLGGPFTRSLGCFNS